MKNATKTLFKFTVCTIPKIFQVILFRNEFTYKEKVFSKSGKLKSMFTLLCFLFTNMDDGFAEYSLQF